MSEGLWTARCSGCTFAVTRAWPVAEDAATMHEVTTGHWVQVVEADDAEAAS